MPQFGHAELRFVGGAGDRADLGQGDPLVVIPRGGVVAEATGTYLPLSHELRRQMVDAWPGFEEFL